MTDSNNRYCCCCQDDLLIYKGDKCGGCGLWACMDCETYSCRNCFVGNVYENEIICSDCEEQKKIEKKQNMKKQCGFCQTSLSGPTTIIYTCDKCKKKHCVMCMMECAGCPAWICEGCYDDSKWTEYQSRYSFNTTKYYCESPSCQERFKMAPSMDTCDKFY
jgi:hypothetical protein